MKKNSGEYAPGAASLVNLSYQKDKTQREEQESREKLERCRRDVKQVFETLIALVKRLQNELHDFDNHYALVFNRILAETGNIMAISDAKWRVEYAQRQPFLRVV